MTHKKFYLPVALLFIIAAGIRMNNNFRFAPACGYDAGGHLSYIYQMKAGWGIPLANEGWSTFHPPLYYLAAARLWTLLEGKIPLPMHVLLRLISTLMNLGLAVLAGMAMHLLWPDDPFLTLLGLCLVLFVPLHIYSSSMIGNEQMAALFISLGTVLLIAYRKRPHPALTLLMAVASGLALLTKYTGVFLIITITICLVHSMAFDTGHRKGHILSLTVIFLGSLIIAGSFYWRNITFFGTPLAMSQDYPCVAEVMKKQPPGRRRWFDFLGFDALIFRDPIVRKPREGISLARSRYVWSLVYSNFWFESFSHFFLLNCDRWRLRLGSALLFLSLLPSLLFFHESGREALCAFRKKGNTPALPLLVLLLVNAGAFMLFNLKTPQFSAGKATYFLASTLPIALFMGRGLYGWMRKGRLHQVIGILWVSSIFILSSIAFFLTYT